MTDIELKTVDESNLFIFNRLVQYYECEFSSITGKKPDINGLFYLDTDVAAADIKAYLAFIEKIPAAMAVTRNYGNNHFEIFEFFVIPCWRRRRLGSILAETLWGKHPGRWEIKQIRGADYAVSFWRSAVSHFTAGRYKEDVFEDKYWGTVTRQSFENDYRA